MPVLWCCAEGQLLSVREVSLGWALRMLKFGFIFSVCASSGII